MYGVGAFITFITLFTINCDKVYISKFAILLLSWGFFAFAFTYGNALYVQKEYTNFRINAVINDLNTLEQFTSDEVKNVQISGSVGYSSVILHMPQDYQILNRLIPINFKEKWVWGRNSFCYYYGIKNMNCYPTIDLTEQDLPIIKETMYHTIKGNDTNILIELH